MGFLHDAAEDTGHTEKEIIRKLKAIRDDWEQNKEKHDWIYEFEDIVGSKIPQINKARMGRD